PTADIRAPLRHLAPVGAGLPRNLFILRGSGADRRCTVAHSRPMFILTDRVACPDQPRLLSDPSNAFHSCIRSRDNDAGHFDPTADAADAQDAPPDRSQPAR